MAGYQKGKLSTEAGRPKDCLRQTDLLYQYRAAVYADAR